MATPPDLQVDWHHDGEDIFKCFHWGSTAKITKNKSIPNGHSNNLHG